MNNSDHEHHLETTDEASNYPHSHSRTGDIDFATEFWALMGSPAHWLFEIITSVVLYLIFGLLIYQFIIVKHVIPRYQKTMNRKLEDLHEELDTEHGVEHVDSTVTKDDK